MYLEFILVTLGATLGEKSLWTGHDKQAHMLKYETNLRTQTQVSDAKYLQSLLFLSIAIPLAMQMHYQLFSTFSVVLPHMIYQKKRLRNIIEVQYIKLLK